MTPDAAREHLAIAKKMIAEMGYHRRDKDVQELEKQMSQLPNEPMNDAWRSVMLKSVFRDEASRKAL